MPRDYESLRALPGIGNTAGAILSIAFQKAYPAVDSNARRVLGRLFNMAGAKQLRAVAEELISKSKAGRFEPGDHGTRRNHLSSRRAALLVWPARRALPCAQRKRNLQKPASQKIEVDKRYMASGDYSPW